MYGGGKRVQGIPGAKKRTEQRTVTVTVTVNSECIVSTGLWKPGRIKLPKNNEYRQENKTRYIRNLVQYATDQVLISDKVQGLFQKKSHIYIFSNWFHS